MPNNVEAVVNQAVDLIGYKRHIGSIWDGTRPARVALNAFSQTRDEVLALQSWPFALRRYGLVTTTPTPAFPWLYRYAYPTGVIRLLDVYEVQPDEESEEVRVSLWQEDAEGAVRTVVTRFTPAAAVAVSQFTDLTKWPPEFTALVLQGLAQKLAQLVEGGQRAQQRDDRQQRA